MQCYASYLDGLGDSNIEEYMLIWKKNCICSNFMEIIQTPANDLSEEYLLNGPCNFSSSKQQLIAC